MKFGFVLHVTPELDHIIRLGIKSQNSLIGTTESLMRMTLLNYIKQNDSTIDILNTQRMYHGPDHGSGLHAAGMVNGSVRHNLTLKCFYF